MLCRARCLNLRFDSVYPASPGGTSIAFSYSAASGGVSSSSSVGAGTTSLSSSGSAAYSATIRPKWLLVGQEGGSVARGQLSRVVGGPTLTEVSQAVCTRWPPGNFWTALFEAQPANARVLCYTQCHTCFISIIRGIFVYYSLFTLSLAFNRIVQLF